jgi:hypothetical protein
MQMGESGWYRVLLARVAGEAVSAIRQTFIQVFVLKARSKLTRAGAWRTMLPPLNEALRSAVRLCRL